jgi:integrase
VGLLGAYDLVKRHALIHPDQAKAKKAIPVPLNATAIAVIRKQLGKHQQFVFTYQFKRIIQCNTKAWKKALKRAGIEHFRWHDLRHTPDFSVRHYKFAPEITIASLFILNTSYIF